MRGSIDGRSGKLAKQSSTIKEDIEITGARDFHSIDRIESFKLRLDCFGKSARVLFLASLLLNLFC